MDHDKIRNQLQKISGYDEVVLKDGSRGNIILISDDKYLLEYGDERGWDHKEITINDILEIISKEKG